MLNVSRMDLSRVVSVRKEQREILSKIYSDYTARNHNQLVERFNRDSEAGVKFDSFFNEDEEINVIESSPEIVEEVLNENNFIEIEVKNNENEFITEKQDVFTDEVFEKSKTEAPVENIESKEINELAEGLEVKFMGKIRKIEKITKTKIIIDGGIEFDKKTKIKIGSAGFGYDKLFLLSSLELTELKNKLASKEAEKKEKELKKIIPNVDVNSLKVGDFAKYMGKVSKIIEITKDTISIHYSSSTFDGKVDFSKTDLFRLNAEKFGYNKLILITKEIANELEKIQAKSLLVSKVKGIDFNSLSEEKLNQILNLVK